MRLSPANCSSCGACANICVRGAIAMRLDAEGFYRPVIDDEKCVQCGVCEKVCPWMNIVKNPNVASDTPQAIAAFAKDESVRMDSSSGGIFTVLAEKVLDEGGVVIGVAQTASTKFIHIVVENKADLGKLRGSKYVQADAGTIYRDVRSLLNAGKKVLFSGTPCQVAALYAVLGRATASADLTTVDVVCHGSPSVKFFEKYIAEIEKGKAAHVLSTRFRDKRNGWRSYSMTSTLNTISGDRFQITETLCENKFMQMFLQNLCLNTSCADCKYAKLPRVADVTLGDYWNIACVHPEMDDDKGTSLVLLNTERGKTLFASVADRVIHCESSVEYAMAGNPNINSSSKPHSKRMQFFENLEKYTIDELRKKYCYSPSLLKRIYLRTCRVLGLKNR